MVLTQYATGTYWSKGDNGMVVTVQNVTGAKRSAGTNGKDLTVLNDFANYWSKRRHFTGSNGDGATGHYWTKEILE
jgi:hypothetical protein